MATKINLQAVSSLFEKKFSDRSGLVRDVKTAEVILREYETATTTRFSSFKASKGFGNTGKMFSRFQEFLGCRILINFLL